MDDLSNVIRIENDILNSYHIDFNLNLIHSNVFGFHIANPNRQNDQRFLLHPQMGILYFKPLVQNILILILFKRNISWNFRNEELLHQIFRKSISPFVVVL